MRPTSSQSAPPPVALPLVCVLSLMFLLSPFLMPAAHADGPVILRVTTTGITDPGDASCGTSWETACGLQHALNDRADTTSGATYELWVASGIYTPGVLITATFQLTNGVALYGGFPAAGGGLADRNVAANQTILSGDVTGNDSGGIWIEDPSRSDNSYSVVTGSGTDGTAVLDGFTVRDGNTYDRRRWERMEGGGMLNDHGSPTVRNVTFTANSAYYYGGGMYNDGGSPTLTNVTFISNWAYYNGGGMSNANSSSPTLTNVTFNSNWSSGYGGGMSNSSSNPVLTNVTFSSNSAVGGGAMYNWGSSPTLTNVTFASNIASGPYDGGGGISNYGSSPTLVNVTFRDNSAATASSMLNSHTYSGDPSNPVIRNTIFWNYTAPGGVQIVNDGSTPNISHSIVQGGYAGGTDIIDADPRLGPLGNHGGSTESVPLLPGSAAINAGAPACPETDQRGIARVDHETHCDIGAYESRGFTLAKSGGDSQSAILTTHFGLPLEVTLTETGGGGLVGIVVTYTAPGSGPRAAWNGSTTITRTTDSSGIAAAPPPTATGGVGSYAVTASAPGISSPLNFSLTNLKANTAAAITSSPNPSTAGVGVVFTVTVSVMPPASGTPTGTVELYETSSPSAPARAARKTLAAQPVVNGVATFSLSSLATGTHSLLAVYSGDGQNQASTSSVHSHVVGPVNLFNLSLPLLMR